MGMVVRCAVDVNMYTGLDKHAPSCLRPPPWDQHAREFEKATRRRWMDVVVHGIDLDPRKRL